MGNYGDNGPVSGIPEGGPGTDDMLARLASRGGTAPNPGDATTVDGVPRGARTRVAGAPVAPSPTMVAAAAAGLGPGPAMSKRIMAFLASLSVSFLCGLPVVLKVDGVIGGKPKAEPPAAPAVPVTPPSASPAAALPAPPPAASQTTAAVSPPVQATATPPAPSAAKGAKVASRKEPPAAVAPAAAPAAPPPATVAKGPDPVAPPPAPTAAPEKPASTSPHSVLVQ
jgi:hypothetical protein